MGEPLVPFVGGEWRSNKCASPYISRQRDAGGGPWGVPGAYKDPILICLSC